MNKLVDSSSPVAAARAVFVAAQNPFLASPFAAKDPAEVADDAPEGSYTYALVKQAPSMDATECETSADAVEIVARFGASVLCVEHLSPARSFTLGEGGCDLSMSAAALGVESLPLVSVDAAGNVSLVVPAAAKGTLTLAGQRTAPVAEALATAGAPHATIEGARVVALAQGLRAELEIGNLTISVAGVHAGKKVAGRMAVDTKSLPFQALSLALHGALLAAAAFFMPTMAMADEGGVDADQRYSMQQALEASALREPEAQKPDAKADDGPTEPVGGTGQRGGAEEGKLGSQNSKSTDGRYSIKGDKNNTDLHLSRTQAIGEAERFGIIAMLQGSEGPTAAWGDVESGNAEKSVLGNMWGSQIGEAAGNGGLGLSGIGEGGGCRNGSCMGIGLGNVGTIGNGAGLGDGPGIGDFGHGHGRLPGAHKPTGIQMRTVGTSVNGRLPAEVIQRVVRQNYGRFRLCYENGLRSQPSLQGRVAVRFVIGRDGAVSQVQNGGSDMPDANVSSCVVHAFYGLSFPAPDSGIVTVTYPIMFSPGT